MLLLLVWGEWEIGREGGGVDDGRTQHGGHGTETRVRFCFVRVADSEAGDGLQADGLDGG